MSSRTHALLILAPENYAKASESINFVPQAKCQSAKDNNNRLYDVIISNFVANLIHRELCVKIILLILLKINFCMHVYTQTAINIVYPWNS